MFEHVFAVHSARAGGRGEPETSRIILFKGTKRARKSLIRYRLSMQFSMSIVTNRVNALWMSKMFVFCFFLLCQDYQCLKNLDMGKFIYKYGNQEFYCVMCT